jgi:hypothetical protein
MTIQSDLGAAGSTGTKGSHPARPVSLQTVNDRLKATVEAKTADNPFHVRASPRPRCASIASVRLSDLLPFQNLCATILSTQMSGI